MSVSPHVLICLCVFVTQWPIATSSNGQTATFHYWSSPETDSGPRVKPESFVVAVNAAQATQIDGLLAQGVKPIIRGRIAAGTAAYSKNYYSPGHPPWNWYFNVVEEIIDPRGKLWPLCECPQYYASPSDIAKDPSQWIAANGDRYIALDYTIAGRVDQTQHGKVANVSNRGLAAAGERTLITGVIINGGEPRNIIIRALGPTLSASGVHQVCTNPQITVYAGSAKIAENRDWKSDWRSGQLSQNYPSLAPSNDTEAAVLLTLMPGVYSVVSANEDPAEGVVLVEAYDVDAAR